MLTPHAAGRTVRALLTHGGAESGRRQGVRVLPWSEIDPVAFGD
ncbi:MAG: hypothetical protein AB7I09_02060 [Planctomycetota bacterium]